MGSICPGLTALCLAVVFFRLWVGFLRKECLSFPSTLLPAFFFFFSFFSSFYFRPAHGAASLSLNSSSPFSGVTAVPAGSAGCHLQQD